MPKQALYYRSTGLVVGAKCWSSSDRPVLPAEWVLKLREAAWRAGKSIAETPSKRSELVLKLRDGVWAAQNKVANRFKVTDFKFFDFPILSVSAILLTFASSVRLRD